MMTGRKRQQYDFAGLRKRETYEELINYLEHGQELIRYPNRQATQLRDSPYMTQLDGEGMRTLEQQQLNAMKEQEKDRIMREQGYTGGGTRGVPKSRAEREGEIDEPEPNDFYSPRGHAPEVFDMGADDSDAGDDDEDRPPNRGRGLADYGTEIANGANRVIGSLLTDVALPATWNTSGQP